MSDLDHEKKIPPTGPSVRPSVRLPAHVPACLLSCVLALSIALPAKAATTFATTPGTGPDKWASVWLLRRHVAPAPVRVALDAADANDDASSAGETGEIQFDAPGARYDRTATSTTFAALREAFAVDDGIARRLGALVHEIEIDAWRAEPSLESRVLEQAFRSMQIEFGREAVTQSCYLRLFDAAAATLDAGRLAETSPSTLVPERDCLDEASSGVAGDANDVTVETLPLETALRHVDDGARVVFVDTRERLEYDEGHIPGAINLTLRAIDADAAGRLADADLVIAYCVKDFRGYEAAKALRAHGVPAAIMTPHGMRGWIDAGLPVTGGSHLDEAAGLAELARRARLSSGRGGVAPR